MKRHYLLIIILSFVFCTFVLSGCGGASGEPTPTPVSYQSEDEDWRVQVLSISESYEKLIDVNGSTLKLLPGSVFLIIKFEATSKGSGTVCISTEDGSLTDINGTIYHLSAIKNFGNFYTLTSPQNIGMQCSINSGWDESLVEFVFTVPQDIEPDIFQFKKLPPITISELPIN